MDKKPTNKKSTDKKPTDKKPTDKKPSKNPLIDLIPPDQLTWAMLFSKMYPYCADCENQWFHTISELKVCCSACNKIPENKKPRFPQSVQDTV